MKTIEESIAACIERARLETGSDFAALGLIDSSKRKLRWSYAAGSISERTLLVEQNLAAGLSGSAIRSGRLASTKEAMTDTVRFKLGEPVLLAEQLQIAASMPLMKKNGIFGVLLVGRRSSQSYQTSELESASLITNELASLLLEPQI
jgi:nitrogen regulatory protein A